MNMKKIMVLGASILQLPAIIEAKKMGIYTIAIDMNPNAIGFKYADKSFEISTIDIPKVLEVAKKEKINGIITLASDMPMRTVAYIAKELKLPGIDENTALKATNKYEMRKALQKSKVPIPDFYKVNTFEEYEKVIEKFNDKYIVKPADNSGSRGIYLVRDKEERKKAFQYAKQYSRDGDILVEEFMVGKEVSVESITINGKTTIIAITDKLTTGAPKFVEMGHSQPSSFSNEIQADIRNTTKKAIAAIGIENSPSHTEIMVTNKGAKIVELGARLGGDCITTHLVPLSTGVNLVKANIEIALGIVPDLEKKINKSSAIRFFESKTGKIQKIDGLEEAKKLSGIHEIEFTKNIGDMVTEINNSSDRMGYVIAQGDNNKSAVDICEEAINKISIIVE